MHVKDFVNENEIYKLQDEISECHKMLHNRTGKCSELFRLGRFT